MWDLYNEPGNFNRSYKALPLLVNAFYWAHECEPMQPLTAAPFLWDNRDALTRTMVELSDVISFHTYVAPEDTKEFVDFWQNKKSLLFVRNG